MIEFSFDDGHKLDLKLCRLLKKYGFTATLYIPTTTDLTESEIRILSEWFEIGGHTKSHPQDMKLLNYEQQYEEIEDNKIWLEGIIGKKVRHFCYPKGRYNQDTIKVLWELGFETARTTIVNKTYSEDDFKKGTTVHLYPRKEYEGKDPFQIAKFYVLSEKKDEVIHIWGHSWEIDKLGYWEQFEDLLKFIYENNKKNNLSVS